MTWCEDGGGASHAPVFDVALGPGQSLRDFQDESLVLVGSMQCVAALSPWGAGSRGSPHFLPCLRLTCVCGQLAMTWFGLGFTHAAGAAWLGGPIKVGP